MDKLHRVSIHMCDIGDVHRVVAILQKHWTFTEVTSRHWRVASLSGIGSLHGNDTPQALAARLGDVVRESCDTDYAITISVHRIEYAHVATITRYAEDDES